MLCYLKKLTRGQSLEVKWSNGSTSQMPLKDLKELNLVNVAKFAVARGINKEPAFEQQVPCTLKHRDTIISAVRKRVRKNSYKHSIKLPKSAEEANAIDRKNGNTFW